MVLSLSCKVCTPDQRYSIFSSALFQLKMLQEIRLKESRSYRFCAGMMEKQRNELWLGMFGKVFLLNVMLRVE